MLITILVHISQRSRIWKRELSSINCNNELTCSRARKQTIDFDVCKRNLLLKLQKELDKSKKGSVDEPVADLVDYINKTKDYCTTSSCSGRFAIFCAKYDDSREEQISVRMSGLFPS